jgi:hypothetical protein
MIGSGGQKEENRTSTHKLIDEVPFKAAWQSSGGGNTIAILKRRTSQSPIVRRSWVLDDSV